MPHSAFGIIPPTEVNSILSSYAQSVHWTYFDLLLAYEISIHAENRLQARIDEELKKKSITESQRVLLHNALGLMQSTFREYDWLDPSSHEGQPARDPSSFSSLSLFSFADPSVLIRFLYGNARPLVDKLKSHCMTPLLTSSTGSNNEGQAKNDSNDNPNPSSDGEDETKGNTHPEIEQIIPQIATLPYDLPLACLIPFPRGIQPSELRRFAREWVDHHVHLSSPTSKTTTVSSDTHPNSSTSREVATTTTSIDTERLSTQREAFHLQSVIDNYPLYRQYGYQLMYSYSTRHASPSTSTPAYHPCPDLIKVADSLNDVVIARCLSMESTDVSPFLLKDEDKDSKISEMDSKSQDISDAIEPSSGTSGNAITTHPSHQESDPLAHYIHSQTHRYPQVAPLHHVFSVVKCHLCLTTSHSHSIRIVGHTENNIPCIYTSLEQAHGRFDAQQNTTHLHICLEQTTALMLYSNYLSFTQHHQHRGGHSLSMENVEGVGDVSSQAHDAHDDDDNDNDTGEHTGDDGATASLTHASPGGCYVTDVHQVLPAHSFPTGTHGTWVLAMDFYGFSWRDNNPWASQLLVRMLSMYPERLAKALILDPPFLFNALWAILKPLIDQNTREKVQFVKLAEMNQWGTTFRQLCRDLSEKELSSAANGPTGDHDGDEDKNKDGFQTDHATCLIQHWEPTEIPPSNQNKSKDDQHNYHHQTISIVNKYTATIWRHPSRWISILSTVHDDFAVIPHGGVELHLWIWREMLACRGQLTHDHHYLALNKAVYTRSLYLHNSVAAQEQPQDTPGDDARRHSRQLVGISTETGSDTDTTTTSTYVNLLRQCPFSRPVLHHYPTTVISHQQQQQQSDDHHHVTVTTSESSHHCCQLSLCNQGHDKKYWYPFFSPSILQLTKDETKHIDITSQIDDQSEQHHASTMVSPPVPVILSHDGRGLQSFLHSDAILFSM